MQFTDWLAREINPLNNALGNSLEYIPASCRPIARHIMEAGGKRLRPLLTVLFARALGYYHSDIYLLGASLEMLHAATLLHDDVLDNASLRRGLPAAHTIYGTVKTILAGDALLAGGNAIVCSFKEPALVSCYSTATSQTAAGEILEMDSLCDPELEFDQYLNIAKGKTGCLIAQACAMGAIAASADNAFIEASTTYGENLGIAFQIVDDALDFAPGSRTGKPRGGDLREGKMTPPLFFYRISLNAAEREKFDAAFATGNFSEEYFMHIVNEAFTYTPVAMRVAAGFVKRAKKALQIMPEGQETGILLEIADFVLTRDN